MNIITIFNIWDSQYTKLLQISGLNVLHVCENKISQIYVVFRREHDWIPQMAVT